MERFSYSLFPALVPNQTWELSFEMNTLLINFRSSLLFMIIWLGVIFFTLTDKIFSGLQSLICDKSYCLFIDFLG